MKASALGFVVLVVAVLVAIGVFRHGSSHPAIFDTRSFAQAQAAASSSGKLFIIKFTATWCPPCHLMDENTFTDKGVVDWLAQNAVIVAVDVDQQEDLARTFAITAMPTIVAIRGDNEISREVGALPPDAFLAWARGLAK